MLITIVVVFALVYLGMILGGLPFLQLDRTGVALIGAIVLIGTNALSVEDAANAVHLPTLILLFSFMVLAAQMRLAGFYDWITREIAGLTLGPALLLALLMAIIGALSAVFSNDIVCLAVAPVLIDACRRRQLNPIPYLLGLACAANIGSAATLIGNPQNILIGQTLRVSFSRYIAEAIVPVAAGLVASWAIIAWQSRNNWRQAQAGSEARGLRQEEAPLNRWQTTKGLVVSAALLLVFLFTDWPRDHVALIAAGLLLMSRKLHSRHMLGLVDWALLILFIGLFIVNHAFEATGLVNELVTRLSGTGLRLDHPSTLFAATFVLSNIFSNVPAVMFLLPVAKQAGAATLLALVSTFSGNLLIVGSIANIIVVDAAARRNIHIGWREHAATGIPVTAITLAIVALCLWL